MLAAVTLAWSAFALVEALVIIAGFHRYFTGPWEIKALLFAAVPFSILLLLPFTPAAIAIGRLVQNASASRRARPLLDAVAIFSAATLAYGITAGRHFASWPIRASFIGAFSCVVGVAVHFFLPPVTAFVVRRRLHRTVGIALLCLFWTADVFVLPRLYPAFHTALLVLTLLAAALAVSGSTRSRVVTNCGAAFAVFAVTFGIGGMSRLKNSDNLRFVLVEHAPLLGRAVTLLGRFTAAPVEASDEIHGSPGELARTLDWAGRDIVLVTIDALRADHVSAYGYARNTTPHIDRLAERGTLFEAAYCPTPHTSYSITSLMTGKYMRPLLSLGIGDDSETWASWLRRYGYQTAGFYPPAVFFIDKARFRPFHERALDFEYVKVEFADTKLRLAQISSYLSGAANDKPLFMWVHFFEPHEPYEMHHEHPFGERGRATDIDRYDSEIAAVDSAVGAIVALVEARRPGAIVIVTADHGEEFGEHGGRYHGSTVYEEQVRVPLIVAGHGVAHQRVASVAQTIDLLPTTLSALGIPRPPRIRGRDLGASLSGASNNGTEPGLAFAETDDYTLLAEGEFRLVCARKADVCALYNAKSDPLERHDLSAENRDLVAAMKLQSIRVARDHGKYESSSGADLPSALRRALMGDADAAIEAAALLDDANIDIRKKTALAMFRLHARSTASQVRRALFHDENEEVRGYLAAALVRMGEPVEVGSLLASKSEELRRSIALALAEQGDARGADTLVTWWVEGGDQIEFETARDLLQALGRVRAKAAVPALIASLGDVRLRAFIADALGAIGDGRARPALVEALQNERYVNVRPHLERAIKLLSEPK